MAISRQFFITGAIGLAILWCGVEADGQAVNVNGIVSAIQGMASGTSGTVGALPATSTAVFAETYSAAADTAITSLTSSTSPMTPVTASATTIQPVSTASNLPNQGDGQSSAGRHDRVLAIVLGSILAAALLLLAISAIVLLERRRHRTPNDAAASSKLSDEEMASSACASHEQPVAQRRSGYREWLLMGHTAKTHTRGWIPDEPPPRSKLRPIMSGPLTIHGGLWDASAGTDSARVPLVATANPEREMVTGAWVSPTCQSSRSRQHCQSFSSMLTDGDFHDITLKGGRPDLASAPHEGCAVLPAKISNNAFERSESLLSKLRQKRNRSLSIDGRVAYPTHEELSKFEFGLPKEAARGSRHATTRSDGAPGVGHSTQIHGPSFPHDFYDFLKAHRGSNTTANAAAT